jgi:MinD-like ATPase involved in chromosome partitioning or flagellar assembly
MLYYRLQFCYEVNVRNLNLANPNVQRILHNPAFNRHIPQRAPYRMKEPVDLFADILIYFDDTVLKEFEQQHALPHGGDGKLDRVRETRNHTFIAHGMKPVTKEDADVCLKLGEEILPLIPGSADVQKAYPFTEEKMKSLVSLLVQV